MGQAVVRMLLIFLPFVFASLAGSAPDNAGLNDAAAGFGVASLVLSAVLAVLPGQRRALYDLVGRTCVVTATKRPINRAQDNS